MTQPLPPREPYTRLCVVCHSKGRQRPATCITNHSGYAVCDEHSGHTHAQIRVALTPKRRTR